MRSFILTTALASALLALGCGDSVETNSGLTEPFRVKNAQFYEGTIPQDGGKIEMVDVLTPNSYIPQGFGAKKILGHAKLGGSSIAIALENKGSGYWVIPMGAEDINQPGDSVFEASIEFAPDLPPGKYPVLFAASDDEGHFGKPYTQTFTIRDQQPKGALIATLKWDNKADLDLHITSPSGKELSPKHPNTQDTPLDDVPDPDAVGNGLPGNGELDRDSNAACVQDGYRTENVVWAEKDIPDPGVYLVNIHMWSACGTPASSFVFSLTSNGNKVMDVPGRMLDIEADGGAKDAPGLFVGYFTCDDKGNCR